jgi:O-succinylbenzoic acid--CoA ligase
VPLPGVQVTSAAVGPAEPGVLTISGPSVALGYRGRPALTAERFGASGFLTTDLGVVSPTGLVTVIGRADDVVVVNGVNVSPAAVERAISDLPDIVAAAAVGIENPDGEPAICAFVEVRDGAPDMEETVRAAVGSALGSAARPWSVRQVVRLPHLPNGKVDRRLLQEWARADGQVD